jgi:hypothetical protein
MPATIRVVLTGSPAWVRVMDDYNFQLYQAGAKYQFYGGYYAQSPVLIRPPNAGKWNVVVDLNNGPGNTQATVQLV